MTSVLDVTATIHAPRDEVYALLADVTGYREYSSYIEEVRRRGDGGVGTEYDVTHSWWKLTYTARFRVVGLDPPARIAWKLVDGYDASGAWQLEPTAVDDPEVDHATRVTLTARYDADSADDDAISLPPLVSMATVIELVTPVVEREAQRVLDRIVADLEGEPRRATLDIDFRRDDG